MIDFERDGARVIAHRQRRSILPSYSMQLLLCRGDNSLLFEEFPGLAKCDFAPLPGAIPSPKRAKLPTGNVQSLFAVACPVQRRMPRRLSFMAGGLIDRHISEAFCFAAPDLGFDAAFAGREARTGFHAKFRLFRRRRDQAK